MPDSQAVTELLVAEMAPDGLLGEMVVSCTEVKCAAGKITWNTNFSI